jgi:hypothetical protein
MDSISEGSLNGIDQFGMETVDAVTHLVKANCWVQALVILYSAIDTLAWLSREEGDVTRSDFCNWVSAYMDPTVQLGCTPKDLYAARCGMLHSSTAESKLSREHKASELWYVTSPRSLPNLQALVGAKAKVVCVTALLDAFSQGVVKFSNELDETRRRETAERMRRWVRFVPRPCGQFPCGASVPKLKA